MEIKDFQDLIKQIYYKKDNKRGVEGTFVWFTEEVGELARAIRSENQDQLKEEFADVFAWLVSLASLRGIDLQEAVEKYSEGCPKCNRNPCSCSTN